MILTVILTGLFVAAVVAIASWRVCAYVERRTAWVVLQVAGNACPFVAANAKVRQLEQTQAEHDRRLVSLASQASVAISRLDKREKQDEQKKERVPVFDGAAREGWS